MEAAVQGETISRKEFEESAGWRTAGSRKLLTEQPPVTGAEAQRGNNSKKQCERRLRQIERSSRIPQLPRGDYKIIIRRKGGLRVAEHGAARLATSIYHAPEIPREAQDEDTICPNFQQNIIVVSTPTEAHADKYQKTASIKIGNQTFETNAYEAAPDCTSKGVIRGVPLEDTAGDITANVITPRNPTAIAAKRLSNATRVIVLCRPPSTNVRPLWWSPAAVLSIPKVDRDVLSVRPPGAPRRRMPEPERPPVPRLRSGEPSARTPMPAQEPALRWQPPDGRQGVQGTL
ncbi:hypothetical protein HPB50_012145 [Hyalomma asiaticum]|uniref:Uncharacterized protein n=1 Tax=Hyalomma asiaticum TaxID=266040 RepID=A0ACB7TGP2_HYAAI|nr:hypothetical protein HPB50_012145 [Hyalomma asiaticum]